MQSSFNSLPFLQHIALAAPVLERTRVAHAADALVRPVQARPVPPLVNDRPTLQAASAHVHQPLRVRVRLRTGVTNIAVRSTHVVTTSLGFDVVGQKISTLRKIIRRDSNKTLAKNQNVNHKTIF